MKRIGGVLLGILCTLCIMLCVLPQKAEAAGDEDIYRVTFEYTNLVAGMKRSDVRITNEDSNVDIVNVYIMQNGAVMSDSDTLNMSGNSVRVDITFKPKSGYVFRQVSNQSSIYSQELKYRTLLGPLHYAYGGTQDISDHNPAIFTTNSDGSFTATWNAVPVPKPVGTADIFAEGGKSFAPVIGESPVLPNVTSISNYNYCKLVKYEWQKNGTPFTGTFEAGPFYTLVLWLKADDGYAFEGNGTTSSYWLDDNTTVALANTEGDTTWIYRQAKDPDTNADLIFGTMIRAQCGFEAIQQWVTGVSVSPTSYTMTSIGETTQLSATVTPEDAADRSVTWKSSNKNVATVDSTGKVKSVGAGTCKITVTTNDGGYTAQCTITVSVKPKITTQPEDKKVAVGAKATFTVAATGAESYQWQYRASASGTWKNCTSADSTTTSHKITAKAAYDGYQYRCRVTNGAGTVNSSPATLKVKPKITTQPTNKTVTAGSKATFTIEATTLKYQWQYRTSGSGTWKNWSSEDATTASLVVTGKAAYDGYQFRCKLTNKTTYIYSPVVTLKVKPKITTQPANKTVTVGTKVTFTVAATGGNTYQWQYRTSETGTWTDAQSTSAKTASYIVTTAQKHDGYQYRCKVTNKTSYVYSKVVTLKVKPKITTQPADKTVTAGKQVTFKVVAEGAKSYQWYYKKPGSDTWTKVSANGTSATYTLTTAARHNGYQYRCMVTNNVSYVNSKTVTLTVK